MSNQRMIKFRAWDKGLKSYVGHKGPNRYLAIDLAGVCVENKSWWNDDPYESDQWTDTPRDVVIEQFTGLLDKNGKEIYEGDILSYANDEARVLVQYISESARFGGLIVLQHNEEPENDAYVWFDDGETQRYAVIGTLHENPELLNPPVSS